MGGGRVLIDEGYVRFLGSYFFASGHSREDIEQTARLGMLRGGRIGARRDVLDLVKVANRRAFGTLPEHREPTYDLADRLEARERLRSVLHAVRTDNERIAVGRTLRGEPIGRNEKGLQSALVRFRRRVAA
jgi:hypothetical protein